MTKLSWPRAKAFQQMQANKPDRYARSARTTDWAAARAKAQKQRQINDLTARIESGKGWIATIPTTDPRWARWQAKLLELHRLRQSLSN
jgi:hypothetical protein